MDGSIEEECCLAFVKSRKRPSLSMDLPTPSTTSLEEALALCSTSRVLQQSGGDVVALATGERHEGVTLSASF